ncbi:MAG: hypothetical protein ACTSWU_00110 [Candidatus Thorarchaeota archaeon]
MTNNLLVRLFTILQTNSTGIIPIEKPTTPYNPPSGGGDAVVLGINPIIWAILGAFLLIIFFMFFVKNKVRKEEVKTLDEINPTLEDLDSAQFKLGTYLAIQGGLAIVISVVCTISIIFVLVNPLITVLTCTASIGMSGFAREKAMNSYRADYKNRQNLEGYMRDKKGNKRRYSWSDIEFLEPYEPNEEMYIKLAAKIATINALKADDEKYKPIKDEIAKLNIRLDKAKEKLSKVEKKILKGKIVLPLMDKEGNIIEEGEEKKKADRFAPFSDDEMEEMRRPIIDEIEHIESQIVVKATDLPKTIDLSKLVSNPILIRKRFLVIVIAKGRIKNRLDFVKWYDYDIFGEFVVPTSGPFLREVSTLHRVKPNPDDPRYRLDEYVPVFTSIFDDGHSRDAVKTIEVVDFETNEVLAAMAKSMGVERKHTAGEINTSSAMAHDLLNEDRDFDLLVDVASDSKAQKIIEAEKKLKSLNKIVDWVTPPVLVVIICFTIGILLGFFIGQNSILLR